MKLDAKGLRYISRDEFRILTATEMGSKNHEVVPYGLIATIAGLKHGMAARSLDDLQRYKLLKREQGVKYDGYRLTYGGYDYLALKTLVSRGTLRSVGQQIGIGKESDVYVVSGTDVSALEKELQNMTTDTSSNKSRYERQQERRLGEEAIKAAAPEVFFALKIHRLGRVSFRNIKNTRDYLLNRKHSSWIYLSRLAAMKEFAFMHALYHAGFPVPRPIDFNRHCVVMELLRNSIPLNHLHEEDFGENWLVAVEQLFDDIMALVVKFSRHGLIHGDLNEFNLMIIFDDEISEPENADRSDKTYEKGVVNETNDSEDEYVDLVNENQRRKPTTTRFGKPFAIDFPQMVSTRHKNAQELFERDVKCIQRFFKKRFKYESEHAPQWVEDVEQENRDCDLDQEVKASGFCQTNSGIDKRDTSEEDDALWDMYLKSRKREEDEDDDECQSFSDDISNEDSDEENTSIPDEIADTLHPVKNQSAVDANRSEENGSDLAYLDELKGGLSNIIGTISLLADDDGELGNGDSVTVSDNEEYEENVPVLSKSLEESSIADKAPDDETNEAHKNATPRISAAEIQRRVKRALKKDEEKQARRQKEKNKNKTKEQRQNQAYVKQDWSGWA